MNRIGLLSVYQNPNKYFYTLAFAALIFDGYYYVMSRLPGVQDSACTIGAGLTPENIFFSGILSLMSAIMLFAFVQLYKQGKMKSQSLAASSSGLSFVFGFFTVFCALCTIPVVSVFGLAFGLGFFTTYNLFFKILSIVLMMVSLVLINNQLAVECERCVR